MISEVNEFFELGCGRCERFSSPDCSTRKWIRGLNALRKICQEAGLSESLKWSHPCYMHAGRNIAILGAFRQDFRLSFFNAALMKDPDGILEKQGPNTHYSDMIRFTTNGQVTKRKSIIVSYLEEAMNYAQAGIKPPQREFELVIPDELQEALEADPELANAFYGLTPGRQKSYVINLSSAKKSETRIARIAKFRDKILAGKGALER